MMMMVRMATTMMLVTMSNNLLVVVNGFSSPSSAITTTTTTPVSSSSVLYAGFGGGGTGVSNIKNNKKKNKINKTDKNKLKPKQQWDRYLEFKHEPKIPVAVQIIAADSDGAGSGNGEWFNVGCVKSQGSKYTSQAVFRQRAIIAEHAKRLHPIQLATNGKQQLKFNWGYYDFSTPTTSEEKKDGNDDDDDNEDDKDEEEGQWVIVDKSSSGSEDDVVVDGIEKLIGFMGRPDPVTGFYCQYESGRITSSPLSSDGGVGGKSGSGGGPVKGSNKKGPGDGVI